MDQTFHGVLNALGIAVLLLLPLAFDVVYDRGYWAGWRDHRKHQSTGETPTVPQPGSHEDGNTPEK